MKLAALISALFISTGLFAEPNVMYPKSLHLIDGHDYEFSLPELTGCGAGFEFANSQDDDERKKWMQITIDNTLVLRPSKAQAGKMFRVPIVCERERVVLEHTTKMQEIDGKKVVIVTQESKPVMEKRTTSLTLSVSIPQISPHPLH